LSWDVVLVLVEAWPDWCQAICCLSRSSVFHLDDYREIFYGGTGSVGISSFAEYRIRCLSRVLWFQVWDHDANDVADALTETSLVNYV
jgi:hypothetical protein